MTLGRMTAMSRTHFPRPLETMQRLRPRREYLRRPKDRNIVATPVQKVSRVFLTSVRPVKRISGSFLMNCASSFRYKFRSVKS